MSSQSPTLYRHRTGHWLPQDHARVREWVQKVIERTQEQEGPLDPVLQDFQIFIESSPVIMLLMNDMFWEVPVTPPYDKDPTLKPQIRDYKQMLQCINTILGEGPQWFKSSNSDIMGLIGFPINAIIDWPMGTRSGFDFFTRPDVNTHWKAILNKWGTYLASSASLGVMGNITGWTSPEALGILAQKGNDGEDNYTFEQLYQCDASAPYYGFTSWDDFFTRKFYPEVRPIAAPGDDSVLVNSCESTPIYLRKNVQLYDNFWLKSQPYSLAHMLNGPANAGPFVGGQVYQAFLSALSYHRWHAPISGRVKSVEVVPGTYYSECYYEGFANIVDGKPRPDPNAPNNSQAYIAEVATRGIIMIEADNPKIGLMAAVYIGMCEVSSCEFYVKPNDVVTKGDMIGSFHFGGSTHCLVFTKDAQLTFADPGPYDNEDHNKKVNSLLATVG